MDPSRHDIPVVEESNPQRNSNLTTVYINAGGAESGEDDERGEGDTTGAHTCWDQDMVLVGKKLDGGKFCGSTSDTPAAGYDSQAGSKLVIERRTLHRLPGKMADGDPLGNAAGADHSLSAWFGRAPCAGGERTVVKVDRRGPVLTVEDTFGVTVGLSPGIPSESGLGVREVCLNDGGDVFVKEGAGWARTGTEDCRSGRQGGFGVEESRGSDVEIPPRSRNRSRERRR
ncbi:hypothetical protein B0T21DRAFT_420230 [Apiosordaria backusii]|uniref:Uncharacterized protein n=1 Tax=Apiosordaria backusii TaxID=314023 RepID=A0AA40K714_9PEZI|nr:hypothetical protein B0T21DRAFT_420230 [Apiosordaria backusii]